MAQAGRRWRRQIGCADCSNTATAIGTIGVIVTARTVAADIDTSTGISPDAGCIGFASRSTSATTFG